MANVSLFFPLTISLILLSYTTTAFNAKTLHVSNKGKVLPTPNKGKALTAPKNVKVPPNQNKGKVLPTPNKGKVLPTSNKGKANPLIQQACATAKDKSSCINTLTTQPGSANADINTLAFISLNVTKSYGLTVADFIAQKLEKEEEMGPKIEEAFTDCSDQYNDAMAQVDDSMVALFSKAFKDVNTWMSTAVTNGQTCEASLKDANALNAMGNRNQVFIQYCSNTLAILGVLTKQKH